MQVQATLTRSLHAVRSVRSAAGGSAGRASGRSRGLSGWLAVTVLRPPGEIDVEQLPAPLASLRGRIEVSVRPASQDRGAELSARLLDAPPTSRLARLGGKDAEGDLRRALRETKQLLEVGEVLAVDPTPHGHRSRTPGGALDDRGSQGGCAVKALTWRGVNEVAVEDVPEPTILNDHDAIIEVTLSATCGSDLHLLGGYIPAMRSGDVLGHEFMGTVVEVGPGVRERRVGERVVVVSFTSCGRCWYCQQGLYSLCDNGNPNPGITEALWGQAIGGCYGYSHAMGGYAGSHARYIRVPYADQGAFPVPDGVSDERALFASDAAPTGWTGADQGGVKAGDTVAVWGAGGVGQMAARAAMLMGAERVVVVDRLADRLEQVRTHVGAETLDHSQVDVPAALREMTGGRGPDVCIEAVGMEAHAKGVVHLVDQVKQQLRLQTDRPGAVREAIYACRKGGTVFTLGVFGGWWTPSPWGR